MASDKWLDINKWFISEVVNYVLNRLNFEVKTIDQIIPKIKNTFKHKYV